MEIIKPFRNKVYSKADFCQFQRVIVDSKLYMQVQNMGFNTTKNSRFLPMLRI